jgi:hypothetical protein
MLNVGTRLAFPVVLLAVEHMSKRLTTIRVSIVLIVWGGLFSQPMFGGDPSDRLIASQEPCTSAQGYSETAISDDSDSSDELVLLNSELHQFAAGALSPSSRAKETLIASLSDMASVTLQSQHILLRV